MEVQLNLFKRQAEVFLDIIKTNYFEYLVKGGFGSGKTTLMGALIMYYARLEGVNIFLGAETLRIIHNALIPKIFSNMTDYEKRITRWNQRDQIIELMYSGHTRGKRNTTIYYASLTKRDDVFMRQRSSLNSSLSH
ncbi:MAG: hypothetical protein N2254_09810 [bacterium]|nr:hypothetical protein [bacterium]